MAQSAPTANATIQATPGKYAAVNGVNLYYEIHGSGEPLVLLHGGLGTVAMWGELLPALAASRQVIAVELYGHGHTALGERPLSFAGMADDIAALIQHLGLAQVDILGYSLGGGVALQTVIRHPAVARKLVLISATCKRQGWYTEALAGMAAMNAEVARTWVGSPMHAAYASVAPNPDDWPQLAEQVSQMLKQDYDWSQDMAALATPTLIIVGDADGVRLTHAVEMFALRGGGLADGGFTATLPSQLAVLPATTHFSVLTNLDLLLPILTPFLAAPDTLTGQKE